MLTLIIAIILTAAALIIALIDAIARHDHDTQEQARQTARAQRMARRMTLNPTNQKEI